MCFPANTIRRHARRPAFDQDPGQSGGLPRRGGPLRSVESFEVLVRIEMRYRLPAGYFKRNSRTGRTLHLAIDLHAFPAPNAAGWRGTFPTILRSVHHQSRRRSSIGSGRSLSQDPKSIAASKRLDEASLCHSLSGLLSDAPGPKRGSQRNLDAAEDDPAEEQTTASLITTTVEAPPRLRCDLLPRPESSQADSAPSAPTVNAALVDLEKMRMVERSPQGGGCSATSIISRSSAREPILCLPAAEVFHWLTQPRSTAIASAHEPCW